MYLDNTGQIIYHLGSRSVRLRNHDLFSDAMKRWKGPFHRHSIVQPLNYIADKKDNFGSPINRNGFRLKNTLFDS